MKQSPSSKIRESKLWNIKEQFGRGLNLAATSALGHVTAARVSAAPELDSTLINKFTDDKRSVVFDGAIHSVLVVVVVELPHLLCTLVGQKPANPPQEGDDIHGICLDKFLWDRNVFPKVYRRS